MAVAWWKNDMHAKRNLLHTSTSTHSLDSVKILFRLTQKRETSAKVLVEVEAELGNIFPYSSSPHKYRVLLFKSFLIPFSIEKGFIGLTKAMILS